MCQAPWWGFKSCKVLFYGGGGVYKHTHSSPHFTGKKTASEVRHLAQGHTASDRTETHQTAVATVFPQCRN